MFISDHETATDLLYNEVISKTVVRLIQGTGERPISIGVHGDWGAGKSSVLAMAQSSLEKEENIVCVWFNGWQFQGFEDAKTVLIERILATLEANKTVWNKAQDELRSLFERVKWLKVAKVGGGLFATIATHNPMFALATMTDYLREKAEKPASIPEDAEKARAFFGEVEKHSMPKEMEAFHKDFKALLDKAGITRLVVLLDDLDRCLPKTAIETLEAIKLFLFVPRAVFVIAADEAMIEYAVRQHFPDLPLASGPLTYARNYLEKLIQVPFRIPAMGTAETRVYIALLDLEAAVGEKHEHFKTLRELAREVLRKPWESQLFERSALAGKFGSGRLPQAVDRAVTLSDQLAPMLAEQTKGNPRQVKRFLNALLLRHEVAKARGFADEIKTSVLAKIMLVERFFGKFYDALTAEVAASPEGKVPVLGGWEAKGTADTGGSKRKGGALDEWAEVEAIRQWARTDPALADEDLRPYILITRDRRNPFAAASGENTALVEKLLHDKIVVAGLSKEIRAFRPDLAMALFEEIAARIRSEEEYAQMPPGVAGLAELAKAHPMLQSRLVAFAAELPTPKLGTWILGDSGWEASLLGELKPKWKELLERWGEQSENRSLQKAARAIQPLRTSSK